MEKKTHLPLTEREKEILNYIVGYIVDEKYSPTRKEIANKFNFSITASQKFIAVLEEKGKIKVIREDNKRINRNIVIIEQN